MLVLMRDPSTFLRTRLANANLNQTEFGERLNKSQSWVSNLLLRKTTETMRRLWVNEPDTINTIQRLLNLTDTDLANLIDLDLPAGTPITATKQRAIPLYDAAGAGPGDDETHLIGSVDIDIGAPGDVAYRINGRSMEPDIPTGSTVIVERDNYALGDIIVAWVPDNGMVVKRLAISTPQQAAILKSTNPKYGDLIADGAHIIGKVVELRRKFP